MLRRIRHSLNCLPRRHCSCDSDSDSSVVRRPKRTQRGTRPNRPVVNAPKQVLRQPLPKNVDKSPAPAEPKHSNKGEENEEVEDDDGGDDCYSADPPPTEVSHTGITPAVSETNIEGESLSSDDPSSLSTRYPHADCPPELSDVYSNKSSSSDDFYSVSTRNLHTSITPEMSDAGRSESQYHSFPESEGSSFPVRMYSACETSTDEEGYNGADEGSYNFDGTQHHDEEMCDDETVPELGEIGGRTEYYSSEYHSQSWRSTSSDRRRRRSLESQARADAEYRDLHGSGGSSGGSKRQRLERSSGIASGRVKSDVEPTTRDIFRYRKKGAQYQRWIDDPAEPGCNVYPATLTIEQMTDEMQQYPWVIQDSYTTVEPMALQGGDVESMNIARGGERYRYTYLRRDPGPNSHDSCEFEHRVARGVLVAERLWKEDGPHWNEVARAQYLLDFNLKTLRHVVFTDVWNEETAPYIRHELYPRLGVTWAQAGNVDCMVFEHGSTEYHELLGTQLGKGVACLVLSSFPRGTMKINRIVTWSNSDLPQIRFVIEPVTGAPIAVATAASFI
ncbi:hypothetical protein N7447_005459 [Penicillium robsamsonii]|uniref:uncharacterized protein n=1 Tax=Penicillium robsamsonii TaxID=1792511 RepID=UPI0025499DF4|nr:uncharacterized protein N7447_005459 [Penicillium robsamsonii]KAJ5823119.1 hypothetical protein N7447_005459 [Penicillium robsamsonii]